MSDLATIELAYVQGFRDRRGRLRHYFRRRGYERVALPGAPGSAEFMAAYGVALNMPRKSAGAAAITPQSIAALIVSYYQTAEYRRLEASTKRTYQNMLDRFRTRHGDKSAITLQTRHLDAIFDAMAETPGAARNLRKRLRRVFRHAVKLGWRQDNPVNETDAPVVKSDGFAPWSETDIRAFERRWPSGTRERLAMALLLHTLVRRSDVVTLGRQHVAKGKLRVRQQKTGKEILIPIVPALQKELDLAPLGMTFLVTQYGAPFSGPGFTQWFVERAEMAGLKGRSPHGLRKAGARRLAEAGSTAHEVASMTGHSSLSEVEIYTRSADQERLADQAVAKLRGEAGTPRVKPRCQTAPKTA